MKFLGVHPSALFYSKIFLRLEPLGLELIAQALRQHGHEVRLIDLQVEKLSLFLRLLKEWRPKLIAFCCNYLANVPEVLDLAKASKAVLPGSFVLVGGHSASFIPQELLEQSQGAIDCILKGEAEASIVDCVTALGKGVKELDRLPGIVTSSGEGPPPAFVRNLDALRPARDLLRKRRRYFIGVLDPCATIEFSRGCPWDCTFCSAWTFYGRSYRVKSCEAIVDELQCTPEPNIFIVDDVAFLHANHGIAIGESILQRGIRKQYYLETRGDVLLRNRDVFKLWSRLGLKYMFLGLESINEEGLRRLRKRVTHSKNFEALEYARSLGVRVIVNLIAELDWEKEHFEAIRQWCSEVPEIVTLSINTPYPGTETWLRQGRQVTTTDYRLFDIQHAVLPTRLSLQEFYEEVVKTQWVLNSKHLGWANGLALARLVGAQLIRGRTNFPWLICNAPRFFNPKLQLRDHQRPAKYHVRLPTVADEHAGAKSLFVHAASGRIGRAIDNATEEFVDETRMGADSSKL
jgi:hopanoid C-3 methylase